MGEPQFDAKAGEKDVNGYASKFSHQNEHAEPGYYSVKLDDDNILAEMTATERVGFHRYTFPKSDEANMILDLKWRDKVINSEIKIVGKNRIEGYRRSESWAKNQVIYFVADFSESFESVYTQYSDPGKVIVYKEIENSKNKNLNPVIGENLKTAVKFKRFNNKQILVKVAVSPVSIEGARKNLAAEIPDWNFDKVRADAKAAWNRELAKIEVSGGSDAQMTNFYTALYHTKIQPNIAQDVDGKYLGHDGKIHENEAGAMNYTVFSLWDTFRAAHPLYTITDEARTAQFINTFIRQYEQGGRLPVWELAANETDTMIGYHAVPVIADAMTKGIKGFDYEKAYEAARHSAELDHFGLAAYKKRGYISAEEENESVSKTLEYAYDDSCIAQMALLLSAENMMIGDQAKIEKGKHYIADAQEFYRRARSFENLFDSSTGFMRPKKNGGFVAPFAPNEVTFNFTEGNSWVYSFFVPQNISRLMELQGGQAKFAAKLDRLFTTTDQLAGREQPDITGLIGQYAHGNEPSHHIAYLYDYANEPWKTQKYVRKILDEFYQPQPDGLIGNEDCGQMSAWYVLSASGFYEVTPNSAVYAFGTPLFKEVKYHLENGKTFTLKAPNVSDKNIYIKSVKLDGKPYKKVLFEHSEIKNGGTFEFEMTDTPVKTAFAKEIIGKTAKLFDKFVAVPDIEGGGKVFTGEKSIALKTISPNAKIYYTLDGGEPSANSNLYAKPFSIDVNTTVKTIAVNEKGDKSQTVGSRIFQKTERLDGQNYVEI